MSYQIGQKTEISDEYGGLERKGTKWTEMEELRTPFPIQGSDPLLD